MKKKPIIGRKKYDDSLCKCQKNQKKPLHPCPFRVEIRNDKDFKCSCCDDCKNECRQSI